jgi:hypothetical protein
VIGSEQANLPLWKLLVEKREQVQTLREGRPP